MAKIRVLSEEVVKKIAAGEVVDGPYSIVKELIENSIDAGAKRIDISVDGGGIAAIRVTDDGHGMDREDAIMAFTRHATSKIDDVQDIFGIETLGFRGEALPSIAAISKVVCTTRPEGADVGTMVRAEVEVVNLEDVGCPVGTTIEVTGLFHNVPARRKYLRPQEKEFARVLDVVMVKALSRPDIMFRLSHNGKVVFHAPPASDLLERIVSVHGLGISKEMLRVDRDDRGVRVQGHISKPHVNRSRSNTHIIVNGRDIASRDLRRSVLDGYGPLISRGRHPIAVLVIDVDPRRVDVNVHPAKTEVRFEEEVKVGRAVVEAVRQALSKGELVPPIEVGDLDPVGVKVPRVAKGEAGGKVKGQLQATINIETGDVEVPVSQEAGRAKVEVSEEVEIGHARLPDTMTIKGQTGDCYIIGETPEGIVIIDQHAAHEKVVYEELRKQIGSGRVQAQELLSPITLELTSEEAGMLEHLKDDLEVLGFKVEPFGGRSCVVRQVPSILGVTVEAGALHDVMADLWKGRGSDKEEASERDTLGAIRDKVIATMACHTSTRGGKRLDLMEMRALVQLLYTADEPFSCPHGRPTIIFLPFGRLEKRFGRRT